MKREYIEFDSASGRKIDKVRVKASAISIIERVSNPTSNVKCILYVQSQQVPVANSYESVSKMIDFASEQ